MKSFLFPLTNRGTGYVWAGFPYDATFRPNATATADAVRDTCRLNLTACDWYVVAFLQAVASFPWITREIGDPEELQSLMSYAPPPSLPRAGVDLRPGSDGVPQLSRSVMTWPVSMEILVERINTRQARLTIDGRSEIVEALFDGTYLRVAWPTSSGIRGTLTPATWVAMETVVIDHTPTRFPYELLTEQLRLSRDKDRLLQTTGLSGAYVAARSSMEQVALIALALIKDYHG